MNDYDVFLDEKEIVFNPSGFQVNRDDLPSKLFDFQKDLVVYALRKGRSGIFADTGLGKALPVDTKVLTPFGYKLIGDIEVGDKVIGQNGKETIVIGVYPQGLRDAYRITFSDGFDVVCDGEHLWNVRTKVQKYRNQPYRTMTTLEILESGLVSQEGWKWFIPMVEPIEFIGNELPIDPYLLGVLIGDGCLSKGTPSLSSSDNEILERVSILLPQSVYLRKHKGINYDWSLTTTIKGKPNPLTISLRKIELMGKKSESKFIPDIYKFAKIEDRIKLLQGLLDTDGYASADGNVNYCTVSKKLAEDFCFLVQSLGGKSAIRKKKTSCQLAYQMSVSLPNEIVPFSLKRKKDIWRPRTKYFPTRAIVSVAPCGKKEMICIAVDADDQLYVIEHGIVTHNTLMLSVWADITSTEYKQPVLIISPLGVAFQTIDISASILGIEIKYSDDGKSKGRITITNYEHAKKFNPDEYCGVVADESSIFKSVDGHYKKLLTKMFANTPMKLSCTATPNPNDDEEIGNQASWLSVMTREDLLSTFFVHDGKTYRLKGHAENKFYKWMASWGMALRKPSDLGYDDNGFILPKLNVQSHFVESNYKTEGQLFFIGLKGIRERIKVRRETYELKCHSAAELVNESNEQWIIWCGLNDESKLAHKLMKDSVEITGSDDLERKVEVFKNFQSGKIKVLVTKPKIAGFGLNFQNSWNSASIGMTDSFESFYQYIRRQYRFGQTHEVNAHVFLADVEYQIWENVLRKERRSEKMREALIKNIAEFEKAEITNLGIGFEYKPEVIFRLPTFLNGKK